MREYCAKCGSVGDHECQPMNSNNCECGHAKADHGAMSYLTGLNPHCFADVIGGNYPEATLCPCESYRPADSVPETVEGEDNQ